jgi:hypothetical protein
MSLLRYAKRTDGTQKAIVDGLRRCGVKVWIISQPCDLLTYYRGRWQPLEAKPVKKRNRKDQEKQTAFLVSACVPVVRNAQEALYALGINEPLASGSGDSRKAQKGDDPLLDSLLFHDERPLG